MPDKPDTLGSEWGALAGFTPQEALRMVTNMHGELLNENARLKEQVATKPAEPEKEEPVERPNWEKIRSEDGDAAAEELEKYVASTTERLYNRRRQEDEAQTLPLDRERAKREAAAMIAEAGGDFNEYADQLDKAMTPANKVTPTQMKDPRFWVQAYMYLKGQDALKSKSKPRETYVERPGRPSATSERASEPQYDMPEEEKSHREFARVLGEDISKEEWVAFRDDIKNVDDYERFIREQQKRQQRSS